MSTGLEPGGGNASRTRDGVGLREGGRGGRWVVTDPGCASARGAAGSGSEVGAAATCRRLWLAAMVGLLLVAHNGCRHIARAPASRTPAPLPVGVLEELRPRHSAWGARFHLEASEDAYDRYIFSFQAYCDLRGDFKTVRGDYYRVRRTPEGPAPLIVIAPILAGPVDDYLASRFFARCAVRHGMHAFFLHQEEVILSPQRDATDLDWRFRENIRENIQALDLLAELPDVDPRRLGSVGISLGGIKNVALVASEPRLRANVLLLAGADLAAILRTSREDLVRRYVEGRSARDGLGPEAVAAELRRDFRFDPADIAVAISNRRVLLFLGRFDDKVPYRQGLVLREKLGEPETYVLPLGHYTSVVAAPWASAVSMDWIRARLGPAAHADATRGNMRRGDDDPCDRGE